MVWKAQVTLSMVGHLPQNLNNVYVFLVDENTLGVDIPMSAWLNTMQGEFQC